jgi:sec-independent protein translocase protein TatB
VFGISWSELLVIALALLVFVGPKDLPRLMQKLGRLMRELSNASRDLRNQIELEMRDLPKPTEIATSLVDEAEALAKEPYAEIRALDAQLKTDLGEPAQEPRFEPKQEGEKPRAEGTADHAG